VIFIKELVIIGAGPAGITAAVYAARKQLDFTVVSSDIGGQAAWSGEIENYTGYQFITGPDLTMKFEEHLRSFKFDLRENVTVAKIRKNQTDFVTEFLEGGSINSRTVIIASGKRPKLLNVPGEQQYKNRGVTYCATCDGPLFAGKDVAVIGGGNSALDAALQMIRLAKKVYLINNLERVTGDPLMLERVSASPKLENLNNTQATAISGDKFVKNLTVKTKEEEKVLPVEGIFIEIGLTPNSDFIDFIDKNQIGEIVVDCEAKTSCPGIFAAGDVTNVPEKQIIIAAGEGAKASLAAFKYLATH
jgi:alkyl hydroperoxide reductase subunit F